MACAGPMAQDIHHILQEDVGAVLPFIISVSISGWEMMREDCDIGENLNMHCVKQDLATFEISKNKMHLHMKVVNAYVDPILKEAVVKKEEQTRQGKVDKESNTPEDDETLLDHLVKYTSSISTVQASMWPSQTQHLYYPQ
ncbi:hypothetical protein WOLCODRAFT_17951 [Wolfiporia cocos MD-104 SS10]|uniref:Uncharacterized protein n=1 Tax=Wolfiporia cocos (strain MD-104) TaxID=742152 RepID=A0A2H3JKU8_WOLCO|nr:hypothetical protein WOLCODRAFT_17951 [Wolfiporia cocos MD-104 SS10]